MLKAFYHPLSLNIHISTRKMYIKITIFFKRKVQEFQWKQVIFNHILHCEEFLYSTDVFNSYANRRARNGFGEKMRQVFPPFVRKIVENSQQSERD